jgi:hypothetical protein
MRSSAVSLLSKNYSDNQIKEVRKKKTCGAQGKNRNEYRNLERVIWKKDSILEDAGVEGKMILK